MIRYLNIQRLAVIDQLEIELGPGLSVLTGETGAGKSILVEAVGLLLGGRAVRRPRPHRRRDRDSPGGPRRRRRPRADRPTRSLGPGPEPRLPRRRARDDRRAARGGRRARRSPRPARAPGAARRRRPSSRCSIASPASKTPRRAWPRCTPRWSRRATRWRTPSATDRDRAARLDLLEFQRARDRQGRAASRARTTRSTSSAASSPTPTS